MAAVERRPSSFAFSSSSSRAQTEGWKPYVLESVPFPFYYIDSPGANATEIRALASGISAENFVLLAEADERLCFLVIRRSKKGENSPLIISIRKQEDMERVQAAIKKLNFTSDELTAHASIQTLYDVLRQGAERYFTNRGLFSTYYLKERLFPSISQHGRSVQKESENLFSKLGGSPSNIDPKEVLVTLGYSISSVPSSTKSYSQYELYYEGRKLDATSILVGSPSISLDVRTLTDVTPSYFAVSSLKQYSWAILTNGRIWRLYSSRVSSSSTNYFEVDLEGIAIETDQRLAYFVALFSPASLVPQVATEGKSELDITFEGGVKYAQEIETDLKSKVFDGQLFLDLVRSILDHSPSQSYSQEDLDRAKATALKLLYRLLFILYAESRGYRQDKADGTLPLNVS
jgi:hypothetical protein